MATKGYLPVPDPDPVSFSVSVPVDLVERFNATHKLTGLSRSEFLRCGLVAMLDVIEAELAAKEGSEAAG